MDILEFIEKNRERFIEELTAFLKIPSISADPAYQDDVRTTAEWLKDHLQQVGFDSAEIIETKGHPIVLAEKLVDSNAPTVLVYGHYDVQPPDPLDLWDSPPFEPVIRTTDIHPDGAIFARGACDDKGQLFMHAKAMEYYHKHSAFPCNVKMLIEGEEEVGSAHLEQFIKDYKERLACDMVLVSDTAIISNNNPSITTGLRGLCYMEVELTGPNRDLHSGVYGGAVANPINVLTDLLSSLKDAEGRITIPNFYDDVADVGQEERNKMNQAPFDLDDYQKDLEIDAVMGENGYTTLERTTIRPTLDINGMWGGYIGEGAKTVLPSKAYAKVSMRLVPHQKPERIAQIFADHLTSIAPKSVKIKVTEHHGGQPIVIPIDSVEYAAAAAAMQKSFNKEPIPMRGGGSIPIVSLFDQILNVRTILMGFGLDSDDIHSPNEHFGVFNFLKGIETIVYFHEEYAAIKA